MIVMPIPSGFADRLTIGVVAAPMFLISGPDLVVGCCESGVVGTFPALNSRTSEGYAGWLDEIGERIAASPQVAPFGVNLVVHRSNPRLEADLAITITRKVPLVITSLGLNRELIAAVHDYGGLVLYDVTHLQFAGKAAVGGAHGPISITVCGRRPAGLL